MLSDVGLYTAVSVETDGAGILKCVVSAMPQENGPNLVANMLDMRDDAIIDVVLLTTRHERLDTCNFRYHY